jgi:hypothetical protein
MIIDWGAAMGRWGGTIVTRGRWDAAGFAAQTPQFVTGIDRGFVQFGYAGQRTSDASANIRLEDVRWLCGYLGRITDTQLEAALVASGATPEETVSFGASLRARIDQLVTSSASSSSPSARPSTDPLATGASDSARGARA